MVYFLGRDVSVAISTESTQNNQDIGLANNVCTTSVADSLELVFATDMFSKTTFASIAVAGDGLVDALTGLDISVGANDEDITFIGQRATGKTEIKKEVTVTLTRKKSNNLWNVIFNGPSKAASLANFAANQNFGARWGGDDTSDTFYIGDGNGNPKAVRAGVGSADIGYGYRIHIQLKSGGTDTTSSCIAIPNCTITGYTVTASPDGVDEETMEFATQQTVQQGADGDTIDRTKTPAANF